MSAESTYQARVQPWLDACFGRSGAMIGRAARLNPSCDPVTDGCASAAGNRRTCLECGAPYASSAAEATFCSKSCRMKWNTRRLSRGAELYDLLMACRYDRPLAKVMRLMTALSRAAAGFRREDVAERDGRRSWGDPKRVLERRPYLRAQHLSQMRRER